MRKIYLAGPDVFYVEAGQFLKRRQEMCAGAGFVGLSPLDDDLSEVFSGERLAWAIYWKNVKKIHESDAVIANMLPWCGPEPDSGTCFEVGYAVALGKPVFLYGDMGTVAERYGATGYPDDIVPEEFGLNVNLMLQIPARCYEPSFEAALEKARLYFG